MPRSTPSLGRSLDVSGRSLTRSAIPDSVVVQNIANTFSQGDGIWVDDATEDGSQDMSITGDPQAGTLSDGSESVNFDGVDDYGQFTMPSELEGSGLNAFAVEFAFQHTTTGPCSIAGIFGANNNLRYELNRDHQFNDDPGNILIRLDDQDGNQLRFAPSSNPGLNDGNRHDLTVSIDDASANSATVIIDGSEVSLSFGSQQSPSNFGAWNNNMRVAARYYSGVDFYADVDVGAYRWHDSPISEQTIQSL